jgi:phosphoglycerate dehydrogenase-like enzyme
MAIAKVFISAHLDEAGRGLIRATAPIGSCSFFSTQDVAANHPAALAAFLDADVCFGNVPARWLSQARRLRWLQLESIGMEYYNGVTDLAPDLRVTNLRGLFDQPAAETALAGLLTLYRGVDQLLAAQARADWISLSVRPQTKLLRDKEVVILGHGSIGRKVRQLLEAFGCRVRSFARVTPEAELLNFADLDAALPEVDVLVCCLPNTTETRGVFDRRRLGLLPARAVFVNVGRGATVDEGALIAALQNHRIAGAVLDVTCVEPLPPGHPLWTCPNTILLQHTGGGYPEELLDKARVFIANLNAFHAGQPLANIVDLSKGY